jgi:Zn-dependent protease with chaperone function
VQSPSTASLFRGPESLRVPGERSTFWWTLASLPITIGVLGWVFQHQITWQQLSLLLVVAMVYVAFARGRLLGGGLRVHAGQFGHIYEIVAECSRMLRMPTPHVFVRDDPFVPVVAIGTGDPYAIVISAQYVEHFEPDELRFLIGRELGHILAGNTRYTSLLSSNGRENGVIAVAFGAWLRKIDYTADRVGLICCGSLDAALRAIAVTSFHAVGRKIDLGAFAEQLKELHAEPSLRLGEWTASTPYATNRIAALHRFARDPLFLLWSGRFAQNAQLAPSAGQREIYAGFGRRAWAFFVDVLVIQAIAPAARSLVRVGPDPAAVKTFNADPTIPGAIKAFATFLSGINGHTYLSLGITDLESPAFALYVIVLVALIGQTFGMMVSDVRVVGADHRTRVGFRRAFGRYFALFISLVGVIGWFSIFRHVQPFERWSRTRLVSGTAAARS